MRVLAIATSLLGIAVAHDALDVLTHREHVVHVALELAYLLPVVSSAVWFGTFGGLVAGSAAAALLGVHAAVAWRGQPMENVSQVAMMVIFLGAGSVTGVLVDLERRNARHKVIEALAALEAALGFRHEPTRLHGERVAALAVRIGSALLLSRTQLERLRLAALVHDLGKIGVTDDVLLKPSELTGNEWVVVERHPVVAGDILRNLKGAEEIAKIVVAHHERLDGSGYPRHLRAAAIPVEARILAVADVFCALEEPRPYKPALSSAEILEAMAPMAGTKLDVDAFRALESMIHEGHTAAS